MRLHIAHYTETRGLQSRKVQPEPDNGCLHTRFVCTVTVPARSHAAIRLHFDETHIRGFCRIEQHWLLVIDTPIFPAGLWAPVDEREPTPLTVRIFSFLITDGPVRQLGGESKIFP